MQQVFLHSDMELLRVNIKYKCQTDRLYIKILHDHLRVIIVSEYRLYFNIYVYIFLNQSKGPCILSQPNMFVVLNLKSYSVFICYDFV